jgi:hypothetical protein
VRAAPSGTGTCGSVSLRTSSTTPVATSATRNRLARLRHPASANPAANATAATPTNSTPPMTEKAVPAASKTPEVRPCAASRIRMSSG